MTRAVNKEVIGKVALPSVLINLISLAVPLTVLQIYDRILPNQSYGTATLLVVGACTAVFLEALIRYVRSWLLSAAASNTEKKTFDELVIAIINARPNALRLLGASAVDGGLSSVSKVREWYSGGIIAGFIDLPFALLFLALVYYIGGSLVVVPIAVWGVASSIVWLASLKSKQLADVAEEKEKERKGFMLLLGQTLQGIKRQAVESRLFSQYKRSNDQRFLAKASEEKQNAFALEFIQLASLMTSVLIVITGSLWVLDGELTTGGLAACSILSGRAVAPLSALIGMRVKLNSIHTANQAIRNIENISHEDQSTSLDITENTKIQISNLVSERYGQRYNISFAMSTGDVVLISSSERHIDSFLAGVIAGVDEPQSGTLEIDEQPLSFDILQNNSAYVGVKGQLISGSLLDNLCGFDPERAEAAQHYARKLGVGAKLAQLPEGLETKVGHIASSPLSMGNIKLINIATQLASAKPIVIMDKPDASLDLDGQAALTQVLQGESDNGRIILFVTHHPALQALATKQVSVTEVA